MKLLLLALAIALNFTQVDALFDSGTDFSGCRGELEAMLPQTKTDEDKAQVLWRLSRVCFMLGEAEATTEARRKEFSAGVSYAEQAIKASPKNPDCYMWHSANVGRECQTHSLPEQAKAVPVMMEDLKMILETLGRTDYSAAWQALSEIYWNHPFKSNNEAINYARKAALTIPKGELRLSTYTSLAKMLFKRDWSASKRSSEYNGQMATPAWMKKKLSECPDREEAALVLKYAAERYTSSSTKSVIDKKDYNEILNLMK